MSPEYNGEERRKENQILENRLTRVETQMDFVIKEIGESRMEIGQFRHDLFALLNPLKDDVSGNKKDIDWLKSRMNKGDIGSALAAFLMSWFRDAFTKL